MYSKSKLSVSCFLRVLRENGIPNFVKCLWVRMGEWNAHMSSMHILYQGCVLRCMWTVEGGAALSWNQGALLFSPQWPWQHASVFLVCVLPSVSWNVQVRYLHAYALSLLEHPHTSLVYGPHWALCVHACGNDMRHTGSRIINRLSVKGNGLNACSSTMSILNPVERPRQKMHCRPGPKGLTCMCMWPK